MMSVITKGSLFFQTDFVDVDLEETGGWTPDCNGKLDYDPAIVRISARVWRDGDYTLSVLVGDATLFDTGILSADSVPKAKAEIEKLAEIIAAKVEAHTRQALATMVLS